MVFCGIKWLCNRWKFEKASTAEKFNWCTFAKKKVKFNIHETMEVNIIYIDLMAVSQPSSKLMGNFMYFIFLSNRQWWWLLKLNCQRYVLSSYNQFQNVYLQCLQKFIWQIVLRCYKKCSYFLCYFDDNSPIIICS